MNEKSKLTYQGVIQIFTAIGTAVALVLLSLGYIAKDDAADTAVGDGAVVPVDEAGDNEPTARGVTNFDSLTLSNDLVVGDDATVAGDLTVTGSTSGGAQTFTGLTVNGNATITGTLDQQGNVSDSGGDFTIADNALITGTATVSGTSTLVGAVTLSGVLDVNGTADAVVLDADADTTISADADDVIIFEAQSDDVLRIENNFGGAHAYWVPQDTTHTIPREVFSVFDDFLYQTLTEADAPWILNSGSDAQAVDPVINAQEEGVILVTTGDAGTGMAADGSQLIAHIPVQADSGGLVYETRLHINTAVTDIQMCAGLTDSTSLEMPAVIGASDTITTTASNGVLFCYDTGADTDQWFAIGVDGDTDATGNAATGTAPTADTYQVLRIEVDADGETARLYIDGTLAVSLTASATAASTNLYATVVANATTTTSKGVDVDYVYTGHTR